MSSGLSKLKVVSRNGLFVAGLLVATSSSANALTFNEINPIYNSNADENVSNVNIGGLPTSFGYFFEADSTQTLNALGFAAPITGNGDYTVTLWSFVKGGFNPATDYTVLSTATFNTACAGCILKDFFLWKDVAPVTLAKTTDSDAGYAITAVGNFEAGQQSVFSGGTGTFDSSVAFAGGGYNFTGGFGNPIPFGDPVDIVPGNTYAFFNANASFATVPGPLPILGAAAAFGWTRKLRRRIKISG
ncbi:hypothetical protein [Synechococcus sp. BA-132 BA5]|uniref:hypothetical protein n=1 Tax=Synechococcus sp. BA-132 BA5 TaxID=3110252 RepID=UPI002B20642B|nr:hypothetical protein [Synechococcus sp. BA-132 BA5]MEA5413956.1 hypothetical protein [Synechococcus sp. BA-132 BA5]